MDASRVQLEPAETLPQDLRPLCIYVRTYRLSRVRELAAAYHQQEIPLFTGAYWAGHDRGDRLLPPPIVEQHGGCLVIVDGLHRVFHCLESNTPHVCVAILRGTLEPLPADVLSWTDVAVTEERLPRHRKFRNLDERRFRKIHELVDQEWRV